MKKVLIYQKHEQIQKNSYKHQMKDPQNFNKQYKNCCQSSYFQIPCWWQTQEQGNYSSDRSHEWLSHFLQIKYKFESKYLMNALKEQVKGNKINWDIFSNKPILFGRNTQNKQAISFYKQNKSNAKQHSNQIIITIDEYQALNQILQKYSINKKIIQIQNNINIATAVKNFQTNQIFIESLNSLSYFQSNQQSFVGTIILSLAQIPQRISQLLIQIQQNVMFRLISSGKYQLFSINEYLSTDQIHQNNLKDYWHLLLKQVWKNMFKTIKIDANFQIIQHFLHNLTGAQTKTVFIHSLSYDKDRQWKNLMRFYNQNYIILGLTHICYGQFPSQLIIYNIKIQEIESGSRYIILKDYTGQQTHKIRYDEIDKKIVAYTIAMVKDDASYIYDSIWNKNTDFNIQIMKEGEYCFEISKNLQDSSNIDQMMRNQKALIELKLMRVQQNKTIFYQGLLGKNRFMYKNYLLYPGKYLVKINTEIQKCQIVFAIYSKYVCIINKIQQNNSHHSSLSDIQLSNHSENSKHKKYIQSCQLSNQQPYNSQKKQNIVSSIQKQQSRIINNLLVANDEESANWVTKNISQSNTFKIAQNSPQNPQSIHSQQSSSTVRQSDSISQQLIQNRYENTQNPQDTSQQQITDAQVNWERMQIDQFQQIKGMIPVVEAISQQYILYDRKNQKSQQSENNDKFYKVGNFIKSITRVDRQLMQQQKSHIQDPQQQQIDKNINSDNKYAQ